MNISYAVTAYNEHVELKSLLDNIIPILRFYDELVIQLDTRATQDVRDLVYNIPKNNSKSIRVIEYDLNNDFASFKNNLKKNCNKDYIFFIDADELISDQLASSINYILDNNNIDLYWVPRINTVEGLTEEHVIKWGWRVDENGRVNYPDSQSRIVRNIPPIKWVNKVHERLVGAITEIELPEGYDLLHHKTIERQERQNLFYSNL